MGFPHIQQGAIYLPNLSVQIIHSESACYMMQKRGMNVEDLMREAYAAAMSTARWAWPDDKKRWHAYLC